MVCPVCRRKTDQTVTPQLVAVDLPVFCRGCKTQTIVNIIHGQCSCSPCP